MLHRVRGTSARPRGVRFQLLLASWLLIAGGLAAATAASAQPPTPGTPPASDSLATNPLLAPTTQRQAQAPATPATPLPRPKANSIHLYGGVYAPTDANAPSPTIGVRLGRRLGGHLTGGLLVDMTFERRNVEEPINGLPGLQPKLVLGRATGQLMPAMAFLEVNLTETRFMVPYAGVGAGYEWLTLKAENYQTGESATATFANFAWQGWVGMGMKLDQGLRVDFELSYNGGSLERDSPTVAGLREAVSVSGVGARVGLDIFY